MNLLAVPPADPGSPYAALPKGANMRVAIRRTLRVGSLAGTPVEDLGVQPNQRHRMTRRDVLEGNVDLLDRAGALLAALPVRSLDVQAELGAGGRLTVQLEVSNIDRVDVYVDDRPRASVDLTVGTSSIDLEDAAGAGSVRVEGFADSKLVAARTISL
jgi:hypothetical protein